MARDITRPRCVAKAEVLIRVSLSRDPMKQIIQSTRTGKLALKDVPDPQVQPGHLLVRTRASLISAGTERMLVEFARKSLAGKARERPDLVRKVIDKARRDGIAATLRAVLARLDEPLPLGYSAAGMIEAVGAGLEGRYRVGERVVMAGAGLANHAERNLVPASLVAPLPGSVPFEQGCFATMGAIALHGVRNLQTQLGECIAVLGVGLVGQLAVQLLSLQGARVIAMDYNPARLALARKLGAEAVFNLSEPGIEEAVAALTGGLGCDGILVAAATESAGPLEMAAAVARDRARVVMVGKTGTEFPFAAYMKKELALIVSRSYGPGRYDEEFEGRGFKYPPGFVRWTETENLREFARLLDPALPRRLDMASLITHEFHLDDAAAAYALVTEGTEPSLGVVLRYGADNPAPLPALPRPVRAGPAAQCVLGMIGAGSFARTVLLPELKKMADVELAALVTKRGASAGHTVESFGFGRAAASPDEILDDPAINTILIATRHANHADLTARALAAGKSVLVEKPLALDRAQLARVDAARADAKGFFCVGFNRRFAPLPVRLKAHLDGFQGPKMVLIRVNAGAMPPESWVHDAEDGGGRILGEMCHFVDLARHLAGSPILSVGADMAQVTHGGCDDLTATLRFADGSLATILYTALGDSSYSKERVEVFAGASVAVLDNFRTLSITKGGRTGTGKPTLSQDKGHAAELRAFVDAVRTGGPAPIDEDELMETALATIAVVEAVRGGARVALRDA